MSNKNLGFGVFLLSLGILWLLFNMNILDWSILASLVTLWPLLLVMVGINIIFGNHPAVKAVSWLVFLAIVIGYGYMSHDSSRPNEPEAGSGNVVVEKEENTKRGEVRLDLGGVRLQVGAEEAKLLDVFASDPAIKHTVQYGNDKESVDVRFYKDKAKFFQGGNSLISDFRLNLNRNIVWGINLDLGVVNGRLDLSALKVKKLDVDAGAVDLDLLLGDQLNLSDVKIDCGASKISVTVPESAGVRVKFDGGMNKTNFNELGWEKRGGYYVSSNYDQALNKIHFDVDMGAGQFEINPEKNNISSSDAAAVTAS